MNKQHLWAILLTILMFFTLCAGTGAAYARDKKDDFIKWVDFNVSEEILGRVYKLDLKYHGTDVDFKFTEALAYLATKNGNNFSSADNKALDKLLARLVKKETTIQKLYGDNKYFKYYLECYNAIFSQFLGEYTCGNSANSGNDSEKSSTNDGKTLYGLTAYCPIAKGYWYNHYDDFGNKRSYGFKRRHLGHDLMGGTGTPIIAVEGGIITELGWNRYGGWRIGVRSFDTKRYYYYAHLRKDKPYAAGLKTGDRVEAGQVIGYLGVTGYSNKQNVNMTTTKPHLHFGLQLIFDESQVKGAKEIWIDMYAITKLLNQNRATVVKDGETKEFKSVMLRHRTDAPSQNTTLMA